MSYIYFVQANENGPIKIGLTNFNPRKRMVKIQSDCPWPLNFLGAIEGDYAREQEIHASLVAHRTQGEWFQPHPEVKEIISKVIESGVAVPLHAAWAPRYSHPLHIWLCNNKIRATEFARRIGVTTGLITSWYREDTWIGKEVAQAIFRETNGEVTPNDFLFYRPESAQ